MNLLEQFKYDCFLKRSRAINPTLVRNWEARQQAYKSFIALLGKDGVLRHINLIKMILDKAEYESS